MWLAQVLRRASGGAISDPVLWIVVAGWLGGGADTQAEAASAVSYQQNPAHTGEVRLKNGFSPPLQLLWTRDLQGSVSYPLISNGRVFVIVGTQSGTQLYALDLATGSTVWTKLLSETIANAAYDAGHIFVLTHSGTLLAYTATTGKPIWALQLADGFYDAAPTAHAGRVVVGGAGTYGYVYSVDEKTGSVRWKRMETSAQAVSPAIGQNLVYVSYQSHYYAFDQLSGAVVWSNERQGTGGGRSAPVYFTNRVYVRDVAFGGLILDAATGEQLGTFSPSTNPPVFFRSADGLQTYMIAGGPPTCYDLSSGAKLWTYRQGITNPIVVNDVVAEGTQSGDLVLLDRMTGQVLWSKNVGAPFTDSRERYGVWTGMGAAHGILVAPASNILSAFSASGGGEKTR